MSAQGRQRRRRRAHRRHKAARRALRAALERLLPEHPGWLYGYRARRVTLRRLYRRLLR